MVDAVVTQALAAYRDYVTDGVPSSGPNDPAKADIRALWTTLGALIDSAGIAGFATLADMNADLNYDANTIGQVFSDPTPANDGTYLKSGASGSGSWTQYSTLTLAGLGATVTGLSSAVTVIQGGTLTGSQTANKVLASPNGASGAMTPRALVMADLPAGIGGGLTFLGLWNASTNSPALASSVGTNGTFYVVQTAGSTTLNGTSSWAAGDQAVFAGGVWGKISANAVTSFNSRVGAITAGFGDVSVSSLSALAALSSSFASAFLTQAGCFGLFVWSSANLSTAVTNDPGQAITVAPASDTTGASGAWVRQFDGVLDWGFFGGNCDGATDNHQAWIYFGYYARWQSSLGNAVTLRFPAGLCLFDMSLCYYSLFNIKKLRLIGSGPSGTKLQNSQPASGNPFTQPFFPIALPFRSGASDNHNQCWLINATSVGALAFSTITPTDVANLTVGQYVMLGSVAVQGGGFPQNLDRFEYVVITAIAQYGSASILSAVYTGSSGLLALTFAAAPFGAGVGTTLNGAQVAISALTGTGSFASLDGTWTIISTGSSGTVINLQTTPGLTATVTGGTLGALGAVSIDRPIRYVHIPTAPDDAASLILGAARVWLCDTTGYSTRFYPDTLHPSNVYPFDTITFDIEHMWENITILGPTNFSTTAEIICSGKNFSSLNCTFTGLVNDTQSMWISHENDYFINGVEIDKLNANIYYKRCKFSPNAASSGLPLGLQSGTNNNITFDQCDFPTGVAGLSKVIKFINCTMGPNTQNGSQFSTVPYGVGHGCDITSSLVFEMASFSYDGAVLGVDGTTVTYASGVFTIAKTSPYYAAWIALIPGQQIYLNPPTSTSAFSGDLGVGYVTGSVISGANLVVTTTLGYSTLPSWATNNASKITGGDLNIRDSYGCETIETASKACALGFRPWNYYLLKFAGNMWPASKNSSSGGLIKPFGVVSQININVLQAFTGAGSGTISFSVFVFDNTFASLGVLQVIVDITHTGKRAINQTAFTGLVGVDSVKLNGSTITQLPAVGQANTFGMTWAVSYNQNTYADPLNPVMQAEIVMDTGSYRQLIFNPNELH